jgi:hypothetical protein
MTNPSVILNPSNAARNGHSVGVCTCITTYVPNFPWEREGVKRIVSSINDRGLLFRMMVGGGAEICVNATILTKNYRER